MKVNTSPSPAGPATLPAFLQPITDAISLFVTSRDVAGTQAAIDEACRSTGARLTVDP